MNLQLVIIVVGLLATIATSLWGMHLNNTRGTELKADIKADISVLRSDMATLRTEMKTDMATLRTQVKADIAELRKEFKADIAELRIEMNSNDAELRSDLRAEMSLLRIEVRNDITRLDTRLNGIQSDLNQFYTTIGKHEGRLDTIERRAA
jgi:uncharacterized protein YicC (UPF0701 family)